MKRRFSFLLVTVFALAAVSLVIIQFVQTRRTFSISDNMFNVSVNNAMDEVIRQLGSEMPQASASASAPFSYREIDSLIAGELLLNGIDIRPAVGLYDGVQRSFFYSTDPLRETDLELSPYRYTFSPASTSSDSQVFIILGFPPTELFLQRNTRVYAYMSLVLVLVIAVMFILCLRTIGNQRKLDQMKNEFINNMTHEFKTPISTIGLACEMMKDGSLAGGAAAQEGYVDIIATENQRMRVLVETLLLSAKMAGRNFALTFRPVDLNAVVAGVAESFRLALASRGGSIETRLEASPAVVEVDELHLTNLVYNLVDNGIKYSSGAPRITVGTALQGGRFLLRVQDCGIGISKEDQKHIFEKFYRVSTGDVHNVKGFGIGLNYVAQVVRLHHGHIGLESEPGLGTTFTVSLPLRQR